MRTFEPWVGSLYWAEGLDGVRILIAGESHYGDPGTETGSCTIDVVQEWGREKRLRFFTMTQKLVCGVPERVWLTDEQRAKFWERVSFCNFVQQFPGPAPRYRPTNEMWEAAVQPFIDTVRELKPQVVVALGFELYDRLPLLQLASGMPVVRCQHPSSAGFRYEPWATSVRDAIRGTRKGTA